jgi:hypothetical protein
VKLFGRGDDATLHFPYGQGRAGVLYDKCGRSVKATENMNLSHDANCFARASHLSWWRTRCLLFCLAHHAPRARVPDTASVSNSAGMMDGSERFTAAPSS